MSPALNSDFSVEIGDASFYRNSVHLLGRFVVGAIADDGGAFHLAVAGWIVHNRVMLGATVIPDRHAVWLPAPAHLILGVIGLADQILQEFDSRSC